MMQEFVGVRQDNRPEWPTSFGQASLNRFHSLLADEANGSHSRQPASNGSRPGQDWVQSIIRKELELWQDSLVYEIRASRDECLMGLEYLKNLIEEGREPQRKHVTQLPDAQGAQTLHAPIQREPVQSALPSVTERAPGTEEGQDPEKKMDVIELWEINQRDKKETEHSWFALAYGRVLEPKTDFHQWMASLPFGKLFPSHRPRNCLVAIHDSQAFQLLQAFAILANTAFSAVESDLTVRGLLKQPPEQPPNWWEMVDTGFTIYFCVEAAFRLLAFRLYFFVAKRLWAWNLFDLFLCTISIAASGLNLNMLRLLRVVRVMRMMKMIYQSSYFVEIRNLLLSVIACMIPLFWSIVFLAVTFLLFSMVILQGVASDLQDRNGQDQEYFDNQLRYYYEGFDKCFWTLMTCVLGSDWVEPHEILADTGRINLFVIPLFMIFVNIGVLNIVIGVFASASSGSKDRHSIAIDEISMVEDFCEDMVNLLQTMRDSAGNIHWDQFKTFFYHEKMQAYLAYQGLDASHVQLIFDLAGAGDTGSVAMRDLVLSMLRLRGSAKTLDSKILLHALRRTVTDLGDLKLDVKQIKQDLVK